MYYNATREELKARARENIIDVLESGYDGYLCDLHNEVFNTDYEYIYTSDAKEMLNKYGVFDAIEEIRDYEQSNFGEVNTDFSVPCKVANMLYYIIGDEVLCELMNGDSDCDELWNCALEENECKLILAHFKEKIADMED